jgi:hypothetical protein
VKDCTSEAQRSEHGGGRVGASRPESSVGDVRSEDVSRETSASLKHRVRERGSD